MPTSRQAIQNDSSSTTAPGELSLEELARVTGGQEVIIPRQPPEGSPYRDQWNTGFENAFGGAADMAGGVVTVLRAQTAKDDLDVGIQTTMGVVQVAAGGVKTANGVSDMYEAAERQLTDQRAQARAAAEAELEAWQLEKELQEAEEAEENRLIEEGEWMLREDSAQNNGGFPPANAEPYTGGFPSFPAHLVNPLSGDAGVSLEPFGDATVGWY